MCKVLQVSRSGYYHWLKEGEPERVKNDNFLQQKIKIIHSENRHNYGTRRIKFALEKEGVNVSRRRIGRLMKQAELVCKAKRKFKMTTDSNHSLPIAENLLNRQFSPTQQDVCYVGDITYIHTNEGWLYLAVVIDLYSRRVVGWSMSEQMKASLVNEALLMAIWQRKPKRGLIWHTDRGSQYASHSHRDLCKLYGIKQSMSRKANCWDNAVAESFFHTLKVELVHEMKFANRDEAKKAIFEYIEVYYNRKRMHSANNYLSPVEYENCLNVA